MLEFDSKRHAVAKHKSRLRLKKLVRDRIPEAIGMEGRSFRRLEVSGSVRDFLLRRKAIEEVLELCNAKNAESLREELADVLEVLYALAAENKIPFEDIESMRIAKRIERGGFERGIFIDYVAPAGTAPQSGLFGPMDYVSLSRHIPHVNEVRVEKQGLLRIPLVPTHFQEQFTVGHYIVTYTEREVLVRIAPAPDDKQLLLFPQDREFYDLAENALNLRDLAHKFEGYWKVYSNLLLRASGFPVPESMILLRMSPEAKAALIDFCRRHNYTRVLLRHDCNPETRTPPRGGYLIELADLSEELQPFYAQRRIVMLQEPLSPYCDLYSCNVSLRRSSTLAHLEIVGPGFDASDLNRGDITPHEVWEFTCDDAGESNLFAARRTKLVDTPTYQKSVRQRLIKIGKRLAGLFKVKAKKTSKKASDDQLVRRAIRHLKREGQTLLIENLKQYRPIQQHELKAFTNLVNELRIYRESDQFQWRDEIILSMSLLPSGRTVCWQIVWPEKQKY
jgi:predicted house-cleaning noncanonical NTP pyrophosphatase (MazG superfamily)